MAHFIPLESRLHRAGFSLIAGIDEAGRGPLAGPVVSAAIILRKNTKLPTLDDSKKLTPERRAWLFPKIIEAAVDYAITIVPPQIIDEINILEAVKLANHQCVMHLTHIPDLVLIDGRDRQYLTIPHRTIVKGDSHVRTIAAASILAKVTRDHLMVHYGGVHRKYGFERHMGYPTREHRHNILRYGHCEIHRRTFTVKP